MKNHKLFKISSIKSAFQKVATLTVVFMLIAGVIGLPGQAVYAQEGQLAESPDSNVIGGGYSASLPSPALAPPNCTTPPNEIVAENCLPGNPPSEWDVSGAGDANIQGYATDISINQGGTVHFKIDTDSPNYHIDIYRMGYYGGNGARKITTISPSASLPQTQPACLFDGTDNVNLLDCGNWAESASWVVPAAATSGIYIAKLVRDDATAGASHITFIVRDDDGASDLLFQTSDTTWQAYNGYGGYSLYAHPNHAHKVSYNRPFLTRTNSNEDFWFNSEYPMIRWLERNGYDVSYFTDVDSHRLGSEILEHDIFLSVGHDEYWSAEQRTAVEAARAAGVNLAFFSGNSVYWKTRWENSTDVSNTPYRTLVSYKEGSLAGSEHYDCAGNFACDPNPTTWTGLWRDGCSVAGHDGCNPENSLMGTISWMGNTDTIQVSGDDGNLRFWRDTSIASLPPATTTNLTSSSLGYEWDFEQAQYQASYPDGRFWVSTTSSSGQVHHLSLYRASSGALVFGAGTVQWPWGLDGNHDRGASTEDVNMQQATVNLFADMGVQPTSLQTGLVAATASTDSTAPTASIVSPLTGTDAPSGSTITISGTATDTGGVVAAVELSFDNGATWITATGRESWSYNWIPNTPGTPVTIISRAIDDSGNIGAASTGITLNVVQRVCPCSIWNDTIIPTNSSNDGQPIEVGVKFESSEDGYITGLRFYKNAANTGTHTGHLWTSAGVQLAEATFVSETASGWQEVYFSTPVQITANTTYVASYHSPSGEYSYADAYFATAYNSAPLRALANGEDGPNGVYNYGASSFPTQTFQSSNYWVDVIFDSTPQVYSIWDDTTIPATPAVTDGRPIELGVKFRSAVSGDILGVRFYKGAANTGTHVGHLWSSSGTQLAEATFTSETASGWQEVLFSTPVPITANTTYVASYYSASGYFAINSGYLNTTFDNPPLRALANGEDGPNAVYRYDTTGFPSSNGGGSNYWVDVLFAPDTPIDNTVPTVTSVTPLNGASNIGLATTVTATFSEGMDALTITNATIELRDASNTLIPAAVSYNASTRTATLTPTSALTLSSSYTARVIGGASGVTDVAGNPLASNYTWTFSTQGPPPNEGPGGPILVLSSAANPFSRYYAEILRAEGLNEFTATDISNLTAALLNNYQVVILGEMTLTPTEVGLLTNWVTAGGNLIAMRPDPQLAGLLGITSAGTTLSNGYLLVNTASAPGNGIVNQTIQFHGTADNYTLNGATSIATLYSNAAASTSNPAVTIVSVGSSGGQAAAFTYDLARSVVYTRQGNPAWAGINGDGNSGPVRSDDLFHNGVNPDWVDLNKVAIPQADEQQRLLANMILSMNADKNPLPRFWYFPRGEKAVVVMTADDHANPNIAARLDQYKALSPVGCSVTDWECIRSSVYIYPGSALTTAQATTFHNDGFEIGVHIDTGCGNYSLPQLQDFYTNQLAAFAARFPALPQQDSERTHCIAWSDWAYQPTVKEQKDIRLDTNYYFWPPEWVNDRPGFFTGSGMPMRFADLDGTMFDVYQATTQMTDESGQSYPSTINALISRALGAEGYYGVFTANMHTDTLNSPASDAIVSTAQANSVPVISGRQLLAWVDGHNLSAFSGINWNGNALDFHVSVGGGANGLYAMLPTQSNAGPLVSITHNGSPVTYTTETIKGIEYANFLSPGGDYQAIYSVDTTPPVISNIVSTVNSDGTVTITWTTDEAADSRVDFGTDSGTLSLNSADAALVTSHTITLTGLTANTTYYFRVTSADASANPASSPVPPATLSFITPSGTLTDTISSDFNGGVLGCAYVGESGNGELLLPPTVGFEFTGFPLPAGWAVTPWNGNSNASIAGGSLSMDDALLSYGSLPASFTPGRALEFVATFNAGNSQHIGFSTDLSGAPWAIFSTMFPGGTTLYARSSGSTSAETALPTVTLGVPHLFRIEWAANSVTYYVDGTQVASHAVTIAANMRLVASDITNPGPNAPVVVDWMRMSPFVGPCTFTSRVMNAGQPVNWDTMSWTGQTPSGSSFAFAYRIGNTSTPDGTWTAFQPVPTSGSALSGNSQYIQYQVVLATSNDMNTPVLENVSITYSLGADVIPPTISGRIPAPNAVDVDETGNITVTFSEPMDATTIIPANFSLKLGGTNTNVPFTLSYAGLTATLNPNSSLALGTQYAVSVKSAVEDLAGNPLGTDADWNFVTRADGLIDTTAADFGSGTNACYISQTANGELILNPTVSAEFSGSALPAGWDYYDWPYDGATGNYSVSGGSVTVDGIRVDPDPAAYTSGRSVEFYGTFTASAFQHIGFGAGNHLPPTEVYNTTPWAMFSTGNSGVALMARTASNAGAIDYTIPGSWLGTPHLYRIDWSASSVSYYIDGALVVTHAYSSPDTMRPAISDLNVNGGQVTVDWMRMSPYGTPCSLESRIFNAGSSVDWLNLNWVGSAPTGTDATFETRTGNTSTPDGTWSAWQATSGAIASPDGQYAQYRVTLSTTNVDITPVIQSVELTYMQVVNQAPTNLALAPSSLAENLPTGTVVGALSTTDPNALDTFAYSLVTNATACPLAVDNASFGISAANLETATVFDFETQSSYIICVRSTDAGGLFFDKQLTVNITDVVNATTTVVTSDINPSLYGQNVTFTATVTSGAGTPTGTVTFMNGVTTLGTGTLNAGGIATFSTSLLTVSGLPYTIQANYGGNGDFSSSTNSVSQTVDKATATITLSNLNQTYTGTPLSATAVTLPPALTVDLTYDALPTAPTDAGSYAVVATINDPNYTGTANGTLVIAPAASTTTVSGGGTFTYDGNPRAATVTVTGAGGLSLTPAPVYSGSCSAAPVNVSETPCTASYNYAGDLNHLPSSDTATITITPATATLTLGSLTHTYDGTSKSATATTNPTGLSVAFTYDGSAVAPTNAGSYAVIATSNNPNYTGTANGTLVISKAAAVVTLQDLNQIFDGTPKPVTALTNPSGLTVTFTYDGSATAPTNAGSYAVVATVADANYAGTANGTLVISNGTAPIILTNLNQTYDGTPRAVTATTTPPGLPVDLTYDGSSTPPTNAGSYAVVATINDTNYTGSISGTLVIAKATAVVNLSNLNQVYDGTPKTVTASTTPAGLTVDLTYDTSSTAPTNAGSYAVVGTINDPNYNGTANATLVISPAAATVTLGNLNQTYDGTQLSVTVSTVPVGLSVDVTYDGSPVAPINANSYAILATVNDPNYSGTANGTFIIAPATSTTIVTGGTFTYDGGTHPASVTVTGIGGLNISPAPVYSGACSAAPLVNVTDTPCAASYIFAGDANHTGSSGNATITITPAAASVSATGGTFPFDGNQHPATGFAYGVGGLSDVLSPAVTFTYTGSGTTVYGPSAVPPTSAGTYDVLAAFTGNANYLPASDTATVTITALTLTVTADPQSMNFGDSDPIFTFKYSGFLGTDDASVLTTEPTCDVTDPHTDVGTYPIVCSGGVDDNYNFNYVDGSLGVGTSMLTVTADNQSIQVGAVDPTFTLQYSGFKGTDGAAVLTTEPVCSVTVPHTGAGTYPITCSGGVDDNYTFSYVDGTLTVNGAPIVSANGVATNAGVLANFQIVGTGITQFLVTFNEDVFNAANTDLNYVHSVINPVNYMLVRDNGDGFQTESCALGVSPADTYITVDSVTYSNNGSAGPFIATLNVNSSLPLSNGIYRLYVCGTTSITDANDLTLKLAGDGVTPGTDYQINFIVQLGNGGGGNTSGTGEGNKDNNAASLIQTAGLIPVTGFAPGQISTLPTPTEEDAYTTGNGLRLEIPALSIDQPIVGIPFKNKGWDVTWLGNNAGYLEGSAYPTWTGNTIITGHATDPNGKILSFAFINELKTNDTVMIHSNGLIYVYQVRQNRLIAPTNLSTLFKHENYDWVTLVTCENYNEDTGKFTSRRIIRAVLISVIPEK